MAGPKSAAKNPVSGKTCYRICAHAVRSMDREAMSGWHRLVGAVATGVNGSAHVPRTGLCPVLLLYFAAPSTPVATAASLVGRRGAGRLHIKPAPSPITMCVSSY